MSHGVTIGGFHSKNDLNLQLTSVVNPAPAPKTNYIDVPGGNGSIDLSTSLTGGEVVYSNRPLSLTFILLDSSEETKSDILSKIHGQNLKVIFDDDPDYYYFGRATISSWGYDSQYHRTVTIDINAEPFKMRAQDISESYTLGKLVDFENSIQLTDSGDYPVHILRDYGNSYQNTLSGKNLLPNNLITQTKGGVTCTLNEDKSITLNGTCNAGNNFKLYDDTIIPKGTYIFSGMNGSNTTYIIVINGTTKIYLTKPKTFTLSQDTVVSSIVLYIYSGAVFNNLTIKPQLEIGTVATTYEPYCGGIPAPNPDYPQEIKSVVNPKIYIHSNNNLFDYSKLPTKTGNGATVTNNNDGTFTISGSGNLSAYYDNRIYFTHDETMSLLKVGKITLSNSTHTNPYPFIKLETNTGTLLNMDTFTVNPITKEITSAMLEHDDLRLVIGFYGLSGNAITPATSKPALYQEEMEEWERFKGGTITLPYTLNGIDDYKDFIEYDNGKWYLNKLFNKKVYDGVNNILEVFLENGRSVTWNLGCALPEGNFDKTIAIVDSYIQNDGTTFASGTFTIFTNYALMVNNSAFTSVDATNNYLKTHPFEIVYRMATPTKTDITSTVNKLIETFDGCTSITLSNDTPEVNNKGRIQYGNEKIIPVESQKTVIPSFTAASTSGNSMRAKYNGVVYTLPEGQSTNTAIQMNQGKGDLKVMGIGNVSVTFKEGKL